jgi:hypothetical protein
MEDRVARPIAWSRADGQEGKGERDDLSMSGVAGRLAQRQQRQRAR